MLPYLAAWHWCAEDHFERTVQDVLQPVHQLYLAAMMVDAATVAFPGDRRAAQAGLRLALSLLEKDSLVPGIERICLELAARFCADAVENSYFREDSRRFPQPGAHNLAKAQTQRALAAKAHAQRSACERVIDSGTRDHSILG